MASLAPAPGPGANVRYFAQPRAGRAKLRVGVFADRARQPRWLVEALAKVAASGFAELAFVAIASREHPTASGEPLLWRAYRAADRRLFTPASSASEPVDLAMLVSQDRRIELGRRGARLERLGDFRLDVAFALGSVPDAALEGLARYGTWRYCFGEAHDVREPLAAVREVLEAAPVTASGIRIHRAGEADRIACSSWSRTFPFSLERTREGVLSKSANFAARALRDLHALGPAWLDEAIPAASPVTPQAWPKGAALAGSIARLAARVASRGAERHLTIGQWQLAWRFAEDEPWSGSLDGFFRLAPPRDRFWADPFPIEANGRHYIFFEELPFAAGKAHISVVEVDRAGRASQPVRVLERDYHLSYPFLVEDRGELYLVPESAHNRTVEI